MTEPPKNFIIPMHKELDLVALLHDLPEHNLHRGDVGTVALVCDPIPGNEGDFYVIEFMNAAGGYVGRTTVARRRVEGRRVAKRDDTR